MKSKQFQEGRCYVSAYRQNHFRRVEFVAVSQGRPGGNGVAWSTGGFQVERANGDRSGPTHGE